MDIVNPDEFYSDFPSLKGSRFKVTSSASDEYNCIAYAAGDEKRRWWPEGDHYWPLPYPSSVSVEAFIEAFALLGYESCDSGAPEPGYDKVVFYAKGGTPTHAARQLSGSPDRWSSKIGRNVDIEHELNAIAGGLYGEAVRFMHRVITPPLRRRRRRVGVG